MERYALPVYVEQFTAPDLSPHSSAAMGETRFWAFYTSLAPHSRSAKLHRVSCQTQYRPHDLNKTVAPLSLQRRKDYHRASCTVKTLYNVYT